MHGYRSKPHTPAAHLKKTAGSFGCSSPEIRTYRYWWYTYFCLLSLWFFNYHCYHHYNHYIYIYILQDSRQPHEVSPTQDGSRISRYMSQHVLTRSWKITRSRAPATGPIVKHVLVQPDPMDWSEGFSELLTIYIYIHIYIYIYIYIYI